MENRASRPTSSERARGRDRAPSSVVLWRPELVLAGRGTWIERPPAVILADPVHRPESVRARIEAARSILGRMEDARLTLGAQAASAHVRAHEATSERARVSAAIDTYRIEAALDDLLTVTSNQVSSLMKERGLR
jgi:hypothetical protein